MSSGTSLFKQDADGALHIWIGGPFAVVEVVVVFLIVVQGADLIQGFGMVGTDFLGQLEVFLGGQWMHARRDARLKKEGAVGAHLVEVQVHVRQPALEYTYAISGFRMLHRQPVAVEVKPVVVGTSSRPGLVEFALCWIAVHVVGLVGVDPGSKAVETIRVDGWVQ